MSSGQRRGTTSTVHGAAQQRGRQSSQQQLHEISTLIVKYTWAFLFFWFRHVHALCPYTYLLMTL